MRAAALIAATLMACSNAPARREAAPVTAPLFERVAVVGASVSAGMFGAPLARSLDDGLAPAAEVVDLARTDFFQNPDLHGARQVEDAVEHRATLVVAVDYLFWFAYVDAPAEVRRARLDDGLRLLEPLPGTLAVGDLPDMRGASPRMLPPAVIPSADELTELNRRIRAWASARPATLVVPMAEWTAPLRAGGEIELAPGERVPAADLMFVDGLHANALGTWYLLGQVDRLLERELSVPADALRLARPAVPSAGE